MGLGAFSLCEILYRKGLNFDSGARDVVTHVFPEYQVGGENLTCYFCDGQTGIFGLFLQSETDQNITTPYLMWKKIQI